MVTGFCISDKYRTEINGLGKFFDDLRVAPFDSDPTVEDTDGDGLSDGERVLYNGKVVLPIDDDPLKTSDYAAAWKAQKQSAENNLFAEEYSEDKGTANEFMNDLSSNADDLVDFLLNHQFIVNETLLEWLKNNVKDFAQGETLVEKGADFLDFIYDDMGIAYHSRVDTWQKAFGYNNIYDTVFEYGSSMLRNKVFFTYEDEEYVIWSWKGDYWNLQSGAETGLYVYDRTVNRKEHYKVADFELPMTLSLYNVTDGETETIFNWAPNESQWWITGFNPDFDDPDKDSMQIICSVSFESKELYNAFKDTRRKDHEKVIYDKDYYTVWIMW